MDGNDDNNWFEDEFNDEVEVEVESFEINKPNDFGKLLLLLLMFEL